MQRTYFAQSHSIAHVNKYLLKTGNLHFLVYTQGVSDLTGRIIIMDKKAKIKTKVAAKRRKKAATKKATRRRRKKKAGGRKKKKKKAGKKRRGGRRKKAAAMMM
jgi:hypothetical protein